MSTLEVPTPTRHPTQVERKRGFLVASMLALALLVAAYSNHFHNSFHFDDGHVIQNNLYIRSLTNIPQFFVDANTFSTLPLNATYRPLLSVSFAIDYWLAGSLDPFQFHLTQFLLLMILGVGLFFLYLKIMDITDPLQENFYVALFAALLFCLHTANTETVNYISARSSLLSTMGVVGSFLLYLYLPSLRRYYMYLIPMVLGALAKPLAVMFAPLLLVFILFLECQLSCSDIFTVSAWSKVKQALWSTAPAFLVGAGMFFFVEFMNSAQINYAGNLSRVDYLLTQPFVWMHYLRLFFIPLGLTADTDWTVFSHAYDTRIFLGLGGLAMLGLVVWKSSQVQALKPVAFGIIWFALGLLPTSSIIPLAEVANEHRIFFPYVGLTAAVVWGMALFVRKWLEGKPGRQLLVPPVIWTLVLLILGGLALGTFERNKVWRSGETLWKDVVQKSPSNGRALMNYGLTQMSKGKFVEAKDLFERAKKFVPNYAHLEINLGIVTDRLGEKAEAEQHFRRAISLRSDISESHFFYARWLVEQGRANEAIDHLKKALKLSPGKLATRTMLMNLLFVKGKNNELETLAKETLEILPTDPTALAYSRGDIPFKIDPPTAQEYFKRGVSLGRRNRQVKAALAYHQSLKIDPQSVDSLNNLGWVLLNLGLYEESIPLFEKVLMLKPEYTLAKNNLNFAKKKSRHP